jgi:hypothetical protein
MLRYGILFLTMRIRIILSICVMFLTVSIGRAASADAIGEHHTFFVSSVYDISGRTSTGATLVYISDHAYFYIEDTYLNTLSSFDRATLDQKITAAGAEFDSNIYTKETAFWGSEPNPGIDNDPRITIFLERLTPGTGGYFDSVNAYPAAQTTNTNQREMIVANIQALLNDRLKIFLSHEFQHLISFNQKELLRNISEDTWLNELRSQYSITLAGYNTDFLTSDLRQRVDTFLSSPTDSLTEWPNVNLDYASATLFGQYLVDRFGPAILSETLRSPLSGISSIDKWLSDHQQPERFGDVFGDWVWANFLNSRAADPRGGYANLNLQSIHVPPTTTHLLSSSAPNSLSYSLKPFQPDWEQFVVDQSASGKNLKISWHNSQFQIFYTDASGKMSALNDGGIIAPPAGISFILMPVNETKLQGFGASEIATPLTLTVEYVDQAPTAVSSQGIHEGSLIMHAGTPDIYVVTGPYKRLLLPEVLKFYGLDATRAVTVSEAVFQSYMVSNYIRDVNEKKVYTVWPDGTKHWLNITAQQFDASHRDWSSIFIVNDLESNYYKISTPITQ